MEAEIVKQLNKYSPVPLPDYVLNKIYEFNPMNNAGFYYDISILLLLAKINYFAPKVLNYFDILIYGNGFKLFNDKVELNIKYDDIVEIDKLKKFAVDLINYSGRKIHDFDVWFLYMFMKSYYLHSIKG